MKKLVIVVLLTLILGVFARTQTVHAESSIILFWGEGCPHCEIVKEQIKEKGYDQKITIDYKEIYNNNDNAKLFDEKIKGCGILPYNAGVPMVYASGFCWMGQYEAISAIEKEIEKSSASITPTAEDKTPETTIPETTVIFENNDTIKDQAEQEATTDNDASSKGKQNTQLMLGSIFLLLVALVGIGYAIQNKRSTPLNIVLALVSFASILIFSVQPVYAVCPVCTVAVGAGLGLSRYLGIDDVITSLWIGGLIVSTIYWVIDWLSKRNKKGPVVDLLTSVLTYGLVLVPLYWGGIIGHPFNSFWGIDKILLGTIIGSRM